MTILIPLIDFVIIVIVGGSPHPPIIEADWGFFGNVSIEPNMQTERFLLDTGSTVTWIYTSEILKQRLDQSFVPGSGIDPRVVTAISYTDADPRVEYVDGAMVEFDTWGLRNFSIGNSIEWSQRFGVVSRGSVSEYFEYTGILGLSPRSDFALFYPRFGFRPIGGHQRRLNLFVSRIDPQWCLTSKLVVSSNTTRSDSWDIGGMVRIGNFTLETNFLPDSGTSAIVLPQVVFDAFIAEVGKGGIRVIYDKSDRLRPAKIDCDMISRFPTIELEFLGSNGGPKSISIDSEMYVMKRNNESECFLKVLYDSDENMPIILGEPFLLNYIVGFDAEQERVDICLPADNLSMDQEFIITTTTTTSTGTSTDAAKDLKGFLPISFLLIIPIILVMF